MPGKLNTFDFTVDEAGTSTAGSARSCAAPSTARWCSTSTPSTAPTFDAWVAEQVDKAQRDPGAAAVRRSVRRAGRDGRPVRARRTSPSRPTTLQAPAGQPFTIDFKNDDASVPHNVEIQDASGAVKFKGDIITGVAETQYQVDALPAGDYKFLCTVHPNMTGTLTVQ